MSHDFSIEMLGSVIHTEFMRAHHALRNISWQRYTTVAPLGKEPYNWGELVDDHFIGTIFHPTYSRQDALLEFTFFVDRASIEDSSGQVGLSIIAATQRFSEHQNRLLTDILEEGFAGECYTDAHPFFSSNHRNFRTNIGEKPLCKETLHDGLQVLMTQHRADGRPWGNEPTPENTMLMVPPALYFVALELVTNLPYSRCMRVVLNPYLMNEQHWYLLQVGGPVKPLIYQPCTELELKAVGTPHDNLYGFTVQQRYNAGYTFPQLAFAGGVSKE